MYHILPSPRSDAFPSTIHLDEMLGTLLVRVLFTWISPNPRRPHSLDAVPVCAII